MPERFDAKEATLVEDYPHYRVEVYPIEFSIGRIENLHEVKRLVRQCAVSRRGWDYPHVRPDERDWSTGSNYVQGETRFQEHFEVWRLYQSGQFIFKAAVRELVMNKDEQPKSTFGETYNEGAISFGNWLWNLTEICEFAYRLGSSLTLQHGLIVLVQIKKLKNVGMGTWRDERINVSGKCLVDMVTIRRELPSPQLSLDYDEIAAGMFVELCGHFNVHPGEDLINKVQSELFELRMGSDKPRRQRQVREVE